VRLAPERGAFRDDVRVRRGDIGRFGGIGLGVDAIKHVARAASARRRGVVLPSPQQF